jgi:hypothetical protein
MTSFGGLASSGRPSARQPRLCHELADYWAGVFRGDAQDPAARTRRQQEIEARLLTLAL